MPPLAGPIRPSSTPATSPTAGRSGSATSRTRTSVADPVRIVTFATQDEVAGADVVALWTREGALSLEEATRRVREVLLVAVAGGGPVGVCTTYLGHDEQLRLPLWYFRTFVAAAHRRSDIAIRLLAATRDHLGARHAQGIDRR